MKKIASLLVLLVILTGCFDKKIKEPNLFINTQNNSIDFKLEHAITPTQLMVGLQNRKNLEKRHGMIFDIRPAREIRMWMKDTLIPLDMIFVNENNKIINISENNTPMSKDIIPSNGKTRAVIEINAGEVKKYNIKINDTIKTDLIKKIIEEKNESTNEEK